MSRIAPDPNTSGRLVEARVVERCPQWPLRKTALWYVKNAVFDWSRTGTSTSVEALSSLPVQLRQELLDTMLKLKPDAREVMAAVKVLVRGGIFSFDLGSLDECHHWDVKNVIKLLTDAGNTILRISIRGQWLFEENDGQLLSRLLESIPNVRTLWLQETSSGAPELRNILEHCPKLHSLEVSHPSLCDSDLFALQKGSEILRTFKVPSTVKGQGLLTLLRLFPNLEHLECAHLDELLDALDKAEEKDWWRERALGFRGIKTSYPLCHDTLIRLVKRFPNLESVSIEIMEIAILSALANLKYLKHLELKNSATLPVSYQDQVLPLISSIGHQLRHLCLEHFDVVDLSKTSEFCGGLTSLELRWFTTLSVGRVPKGVKPFMHLKSLCLRPRTNRHVTMQVCLFLLSHCDLVEKLELYCCHGLDDSLLSQVLKTNSLSNLRVVLLRHGHGITGNGLKNLVSKSSHLEEWDFGALAPTK